mmetsp:Transcript_10416/g.22851  ORF Transcript_10416/g.22851 Transcript_10416/m.22851 type:complete len:211 (+) Transcript_10416:808-1440(+)
MRRTASPTTHRAPKVEPSNLTRSPRMQPAPIRHRPFKITMSPNLQGPSKTTSSEIMHISPTVCAEGTSGVTAVCLGLDGCAALGIRLGAGPVSSALAMASSVAFSKNTSIGIRRSGTFCDTRALSINKSSDLTPRSARGTDHNRLSPVPASAIPVRPSSRRLPEKAFLNALVLTALGAGGLLVADTNTSSDSRIVPAHRGRACPDGMFTT